MLCDHDQLGKFSISEQHPAGLNPREGDAFSMAQAEIDKLNNIHAEGGVDWQKVASHCQNILASEGKDLSVAVWLLCAWTRLRGLAGLSDGVHVLKDMLVLYWADLTPPPARLRARRNQAEWLLEWLDKALQDTFEPIPADSAERLRSDWEALDTFWQEQDAEAPGWFRLRRRLAEIPSIAAVEVAPPVPAATEQPTPVAPATPAPPHVSTPAALPVAAAMAAPPAIALGAVEALPVAVPHNDEGVESAVEKVFESLLPIQNWCLDQRPTLPLFLRLNRQAAWITLEHLPASQGRTTRLPAPPEQQCDTFARLQQAAEPLDVVRFCEGRIASFPLWLDLHRVSHNALTQAGAASAANTVALELRHLLARLPGLEGLTFADGMPFADGATQAWLQALQPVAAGAPQAQDSIELAIEAAGQTAAEGRLPQALSDLQQTLQGAANERDRFRARSAQCLLMHRFDPQANLFIALETLLLQADELRLGQWEPEQVRPLLEMMLEHSDDPDWSRRLARLDLPGLWRNQRQRSA
nr:type VI secretion system protein TssA [uncultured Pseudomonas sp.]